MGLPDRKIEHFKIGGHISACKNRGVMISPKIPQTGHALSTNVLNYAKTKMLKEYNTQY